MNTSNIGAQPGYTQQQKAREQKSRGQEAREQEAREQQPQQARPKYSLYPPGGRPGDDP